MNNHTKGKTMINEIQRALREYKSDDSLQITLATTFADLQLDSLDTVELFMQLEDRFSVSIDAGDDIDTVGDLIAAIERARG